MLNKCQEWLEGAESPFTIIADQKKFQYLCEAKCLNPCMAHWALFFNRFYYINSYYYKNSKVVLSLFWIVSSWSGRAWAHCYFQVQCQPLQMESWRGHRHKHRPKACSAGKTYISINLFSTLSGLHDILGSGHQGSRQTLSLLKCWYWWPSMTGDVWSGTSAVAQSLPYLRNLDTCL